MLRHVAPCCSPSHQVPGLAPYPGKTEKSQVRENTYMSAYTDRILGVGSPAFPSPWTGKDHHRPCRLLVVVAMVVLLRGVSLFSPPQSASSPMAAQVTQWCIQVETNSSQHPLYYQSRSSINVAIAEPPSSKKKRKKEVPYNSVGMVL